MINKLNEGNTDLEIAAIIAREGIPKPKIVLVFISCLLEGSVGIWGDVIGNLV